MGEPERRAKSAFIPTNIYPSGPDRIKCIYAVIDINVIQRSDTQQQSIPDRRMRGRADDYSITWNFS